MKKIKEEMIEKAGRTELQEASHKEKEKSKKRGSQKEREKILPFKLKI